MLCFHAWHGEPVKRKDFLTNYCKEGYPTDSKTDNRLDILDALTGMVVARSLST